MRRKVQRFGIACSSGMDKLGRFRHEGRDAALEFAAACAIGKVEQFQWRFPIS